jgi:hypothetical protein
MIYRMLLLIPRLASIYFCPSSFDSFKQVEVLMTVQHNKGISFEPMVSSDMSPDITFMYVVKRGVT